MKQLFRRHEYGMGGERGLVLFFCPYGIGAWQFALPGLPIWRLRRAGWRVVAYDYPLAVANRDAQTSRRYLEAVIESALADAAAAQGRVVAYGVSLGSVPALQVAVRAAGVDRLILNLPWTNPAANIAHLPRMLLIPAWLKRRFIARSGGLAQLSQTLEPIWPQTAAAELTRDVRVLVWVARQDRLMKYPDGADFRRALENRLGDRLTWRENRVTGHYLSALRNNLAARQYLEFLR